MRSSTLTLLALGSSVAAVGNAVVKNNCPTTFYLWSVGGSVGPQQTIAPGQNYTEALRRDPTTGGIALKMTKTPDGLYTGAPTQIFSYSLDGSLVWYDMSAVFGAPFNGQRLTVSGGGGTIDWPQGTNPGGSQVKLSSSDSNVVFTACA
ncbi:putative BYS1 domain protein [Sporormia fimetaria CBS 119925]|uniref:BYS1 domain protein n=1 Tax=Sporormia fimetaria CBS 119925 TaxID=1340428 RepID=A0A6A6UX87_9PLEO|nr:putative BYS1 domain protein [Sporormia fimetaria CBS 119925]